MSAILISMWLPFNIALADYDSCVDRCSDRTSSCNDRCPKTNSAKCSDRCQRNYWSCQKRCPKKKYKSYRGPARSSQ